MKLATQQRLAMVMLDSAAELLGDVSLDPGVAKQCGSICTDLAEMFAVFAARDIPQRDAAWIAMVSRRFGELAEGVRERLAQ